jgi:hypothetical protein
MTEMVGEDESSFTMSDGRSPFKVPKAGLSAKLQEKIRGMAQKMADGGAVAFGGAGSAPVVYDQFGNPVPNFDAPPASPVAPVASTPLDGGQFGNISAPPPAAAAPPAFDINARVAELEKLPSLTSKAAGDADEAKRAAAFNESQAPARAAADLGIRPKGTPSPGPKVDTIGPQTPAPKAPQSSGGVGGMPGMADMKGGLEVQKGAGIVGAGIEAQKGQQTAEALGAYEKQLQASALDDKMRTDEARMRTDAAMASYKSAQDEMRNINTTVDPGRFWASRSTMGKITGIIGLALGALGAGPDGVNRAAQMMGQAIDRDLEAQKAEHALRLKKGQAAVDGAQSAYAMEHQRFGNEVAASSAAKASLLGLAENNLRKIAAGAAGPAAQAQALALAGQLQTQKGQLESAAANTTFDNETARRTANAAVAAAGAKATGLDPKSKDLLMEVEARNQSIQQNGNKLLGLIDSYGTAEKMAPGVEVQMRQLATDMAIDAAKLKDPGSVVRPNEMQTEIDNIFAPGFMQRSSAAKAQIQSMMKNADERRQTSYAARGK